MNPEEEKRINEITEKIIGCAFKVHNELGCGFLEKVYENALSHEVGKTGLRVEQQYRIDVFYDTIIVGEYCADLLVERLVLVELKAAKGGDEVHAAQCLNYLKATRLDVCLLLNFGQPRLQIKRLRLYPKTTDELS